MLSMLHAEHTVRRLSVPLTERDLADPRLIHHAPDGVGGSIVRNGSDAALVRSLFERGVAAWREDVEVHGCAALADDEEYAQHAAAVRAGSARRREPANADDA